MSLGSSGSTLNLAPAPAGSGSGGAILGRSPAPPPIRASWVCSAAGAASDRTFPSGATSGARHRIIDSAGAREGPSSSVRSSFHWLVCSACRQSVREDSPLAAVADSPAPCCSASSSDWNASMPPSPGSHSSPAGTAEARHPVLSGVEASGIGSHAVLMPTHQQAGFHPSSALSRKGIPPFFPVPIPKRHAPSHGGVPL